MNYTQNALNEEIRLSGIRAILHRRTGAVETSRLISSFQYLSDRILYVCEGGERLYGQTTRVLNKENILQRAVVGGNKQINSIIHSPSWDACLNSQCVSCVREGLFCVMSVNVLSPYSRSVESMPQRLFALGSRSKDSCDIILMAIWHSTIMARRPSRPYSIKILYFANAPFKQSCQRRGENSLLFSSRYFISCRHFVIPRRSCQSCYGNLSRWIHGFWNMFSQHGMFI